MSLNACLSLSFLSSSVAQAVMQLACFCRLTLIIITFGVDADVLDIQLFTLLLGLLAGVVFFQELVQT